MQIQIDKHLDGKIYNVNNKDALFINKQGLTIRWAQHLKVDEIDYLNKVVSNHNCPMYLFKSKSGEFGIADKRNKQLFLTKRNLINIKYGKPSNSFYFRNNCNYPKNGRNH